MWTIISNKKPSNQQNVLPLVFDFVAVTHIYLFIYSLLKIEKLMIVSKGSRKDLFKNIKETKSKEGSPHRIKDV